MDEVSEAERKHLGAAGGIAVHEGAKSDLMNDSLAGESLGQNADHETEHGRASVETFGLSQLFRMDGACSTVLKPLLVGLHGIADAIDVANCNLLFRV